MSSKLMSQNELFSEFPTLESERLTFKKIGLANAGELLHIRGSVEGAKYGPEPWTDIEFVRGKIMEYQQWFEKKENIIWGIYLKENNKLIGHFNYNYIRQYLGMIGYHLAEEEWNKGYATEALKKVLGFLYDRTDVHRIQATVHKDHDVSVRLLEKVGFTNEGLLRHRAFWQGKFCDLYMFSLLKGELII